MKNLLFIIGFLILIGCNDKKDYKKEESELKIILPLDGLIVSGTVTIMVSYSESIDLVTVEYYVNSKLLGSSSTSPFSYSWNTTSWSNGKFELYAIGYMSNDDILISNIVSGTIYNEAPEEANVIFDTSDFFPTYRGYKYNIGHQTGVCGEPDYAYCYLIYTATVKNIGGKVAINVKVRLTVIVPNNLFGSPTSGNSYFTAQINFGSLQPGESKTNNASSQYSCLYGPGNYSCFSEITIDDVITNITWQ